MLSIRSSKLYVTSPILCVLSGNTNTSLSGTSRWLLQQILVDSSLNKMQIDEINTCGRINKVVHQSCYGCLFYIFSISVMSELWESEQWACHFMTRGHFPKLCLLCGLTTAGLGNLGVDCHVLSYHMLQELPLLLEVFSISGSPVLCLSSYAPKIWGVRASVNVRFSKRKLEVQKSLWLPWSNTMLIRAGYKLQTWKNKVWKELFIMCPELQNHMLALLLGDTTIKLSACKHFIMKGQKWILQIPFRQELHIYLRSKYTFWVPSLTYKCFTVNGRKILLS